MFYRIYWLFISNPISPVITSANFVFRGIKTCFKLGKKCFSSISSAEEGIQAPSYENSTDYQIDSDSEEYHSARSYESSEDEYEDALSSSQSNPNSPLRYPGFRLFDSSKDSANKLDDSRVTYHPF